MDANDPDSKPGNLDSVGYSLLVRDFDRAWPLAWLAGPQNFLVQQAREESWAKAKINRSAEPLPFRLNLTALAKLLGCDRSLMSKALHDLKVKRIFMDAGGGYLLINKDFGTWRNPEAGTPLLTAEQVRFARSAKDLAKASVRLSGTLPPRAEIHTPPCEKPHAPPCGIPHAPRAEIHTVGIGPPGTPL